MLLQPSRRRFPLDAACSEERPAHAPSRTAHEFVLALSHQMSDGKAGCDAGYFLPVSYPEIAEKLIYEATATDVYPEAHQGGKDSQRMHGLLVGSLFGLGVLSLQAWRKARLKRTSCERLDVWLCRS